MTPHIFFCNKQARIEKKKNYSNITEKHIKAFVIFLLNYFSR
jgi:hypothetical protein